MASSEEAAYLAFQEKVRRTVYIDNLSPQVTMPVLRTALDQFGAVKSVEFIPNYLGPKSLAQCALVEMENKERAKSVITTLTQFPFMVFGMPRPVRARAAEPEMFYDRPKKPGRRIHCRWLDPNEPDFEVAKKLKRLVHKHNAEASCMLKQQLEQEEKLAKQQAETLKTNYKKFEMINSLIGDRTAQRLARHYNMRVLEDR